MKRPHKNYSTETRPKRLDSTVRNYVYCLLPTKNPPLVNISYHDDKPQQEAADDRETRAKVCTALLQHLNVSRYVIDGILYTTEEDQLVLTYSIASFAEWIGQDDLIIAHTQNKHWLLVSSRVSTDGYRVGAPMPRNQLCPMTDRARATFLGQWLDK